MMIKWRLQDPSEFPSETQPHSQQDVVDSPAKREFVFTIIPSPSTPSSAIMLRRNSDSPMPGRPGPTRIYALLMLLFLQGCSRDEPVPADGNVRVNAADRTVVVYSALDEEFARPILDQLGRRLGLKVVAKFDIESTKTVGLTNALIEESPRPRCDLFWNNEILNTLRLKRRNLLEPFRVRHSDDLPEPFRDPDGQWYGFAARARILLVNTRLVAEKDHPSSIHALEDPRWKGKVAIAKPLFGTTATHAACLFSVWGDERARAFFESIKSNQVQVLSGNRQVAKAVGDGSVWIGLTDTDDAIGELEAGSPVAIIYPDRRPGELGTLFIPNTLALIRRAPHPEAAAILADAILSPEVEGSLAEGPSAQIPLLRSTKSPARVETTRSVQAMEVDFEKAAELWEQVAEFLAELFAD